MRYLYILTILIILCIHTLSAEAFEIKVEPDISIADTYISDQNIYMAGLRTWFDATHEEDLISIALDQTISGTIFGDVFLFGNIVNLKGEFFDDVRIVANEVFVSGVANKDLIIVARNVVIEQGAIINGDTLILANSVIMKGQVLGQTQITANMVNVTGTISGPTTITSQKVLFSKDALISSELSYFSPQRATIESGAQITQQLNFNQIESISENDVIKKIFFGLVSFWAIIKLVATLFMIFILTQLFRVFTQRVSNIIQEKKIFVFVIGTLSILGIPLLFIILFASIVLIPVAIILGFIFGSVIILLPAMSSIISAVMYQKYILKKDKASIDFNISALALVVLTFIGFVPVVGSFMLYLLHIASFGAISVYIYEQVRRKNIRL